MKSTSNADVDYYELKSKITLCKKDLILPVFIRDDDEKQISKSQYFQKIPSSYVTKYIDSAIKKGIESIIIFGISKKNRSTGNIDYRPNDVVINAIDKIKSEFKKKIKVFADVCICQDNPLGHCGIFMEKSNSIDNDATLNILGKLSIKYAEAGADYISPSSMMDGQVKYLRTILDDQGFKNTKILSFSAKHNSSLYSPFRNNMFLDGTLDKIIDKSDYQVSFYNPHETIREIQTDLNEGANMVMIKPSIFYLDLIYRVKKSIDAELVVQNVSGEYYLFKACLKNGIIVDERSSVIAFLESIKQAGADKIITYFSSDFVKYLK